jgi:hypothetical protein
MPWYLYLALKQLFPTGRRFPFFTVISVLGVALGVMLLVVSISVMGGFGREIRRMIVDTQGEVQVRRTASSRSPRGAGRLARENPRRRRHAVCRGRGHAGTRPQAGLPRRPGRGSQPRINAVVPLRASCGWVRWTT